MNHTFRHMSALLIIFYLLIPVMGFAHVGDPDIGITNIRSTGGVASSPCDHCPCSDEQGSRCCDTNVCCCAFHCPPEQSGQVKYAPIEIAACPADSFRMLPFVYISIDVPPQNRFHGRFSDLIKQDTYRCRLQLCDSAAT
jgi:hypothetical protein